jgi:hypothetical protein
MENRKTQYFENIKSPQHQEFVESQHHCILCGTTLELQHVRADDKMEIHEEAHCTSCEIRTRKKVYKLS